MLKPARLTPLSVLLLMEIVGDLLPPGVVNVVNGAEAPRGHLHDGVRAEALEVAMQPAKDIRTYPKYYHLGIRLISYVRPN